MPVSDKHDFDDIQLVQYLLGRLPAEESERLDELSVKDDDFALRLREAENDLVDAYVRSELSGKTLEDFRAFYLSSPKRREKVAFAEGLLQFQANAARVATQPTKKNSFFLRVFAPKRIGLQFAAAAFVMSLIFGYLLFDNARLRKQLEDAHAQQSSIEQHNMDLKHESHELGLGAAGSETGRGAALDHLTTLSLVLPPPVRGLSSLKALTVDPNADLVVLVLILESTEFPRYRVTLKDASNNEIVWRSAELEAASADNKPGLTVSFRASLLKTQNYTAEVAGLSHEGKARIIGDYPFHVVLK